MRVSEDVTSADAQQEAESPAMTEEPTPDDRLEHSVVVDGNIIRTRRLTLRPWRVDDAPGAMAIFGDPDVTRWMAPALTVVSTQEAMEGLLASWRDEAASLDTPQGRWAVIETTTGELVGGAALLLLPPYRIDLEVGWHLGQSHWGHGYASEAGHAVAHQALLQGEDEVFAVVRTNNRRGCATALRVGMEWVGETEKYYDLRLNVYRLRSGDLDVSAVTHPTDSRDADGLIGDDLGRSGTAP